MDDKNEDHDEDLEPVAGLSSASAIIALHLGKAKDPVSDYTSDSSSAALHPCMHPVFTHQCFENEVIQGYIPFPDETEKAFQLARKFHISNYWKNLCNLVHMFGSHVT